MACISQAEVEPEIEGPGNIDASIKSFTDFAQRIDVTQFGD